MPSNSEELHLIEAKLIALNQEKESLLNRQKELLSMQELSATSYSPPTSLSTQDKVDLFASLFQGRSDIHAVRWENKQGRNGYSLACANEWQQNVCHKPKIKCGECTNQSFLSLDKKAIYDHLAGQRIVGLYPLLGDDSCKLLAVDFDKSDWQLAVTAFRKACIAWGLSCAIERSRSGNGAHVWLFFETAIPARDARRLGFALLDKAMESHAGLSFESYDRLFPNQDMMPDGGFGNLIALPLQYVPRQLGNSAFINEEFIAYQDQWGYLASIKRISCKQVVNCIGFAEQGKSDRSLELKPWEKSLPIPKDIISGCPDSIIVVMANRIYIPSEELPQVLLARLKRLASFSNPVFFKTQALRFSTHGIPRFICLATIEQGYLSLPRGCFDDVVTLLDKQSIAITLDDKRKTGSRLKGLKFKGELRKDQKKAVSDLVKYDVGVLHAPTAFGKTVTAIGLIHKRKVNTLILVHSRQLLDQWKERLTMFLEGVEIGVIGGGKRKPTGEIDVATYQSMINRGDNSVNECLFDYGQIIIDECHHISAPKYEMLLGEVHAKYILGVTATPQRQDGHQPIIFMQAGPIRHAVKSDSRHQFDQKVIVRQLFHTPPLEITHSDKLPHISKIYQWLAENDERNKKIIDDVLAEVVRKRNPIVLTERREHALVLAELLVGHNVSFQVLRGAMKAKERKAAMDALDDTQVLIATGKYIGEGFDLPKLDTLFLALPISWKGSLVQYAGRIHRQTEGKTSVLIYDYVDESLPTLQRMYQRRSKGYDAMGYTIVEGAEDGLVQSNMELSTDL